MSEERRSDTLTIIGWFVLTRAIVAGAAFLGAAHPNPGYHLQSLGGPDAPTWLAPFVRWDAAYYVDLARNGYPPAGATPVYHAAFFPLYPLAIRALDLLLHDTVVSAVLIAHACALGAALLLGRLARSVTAPLLFLASPGAGFLAFPYSEALFCLLVTAALLAVRDDRFWLAGLLGALASGCRPPGMVIAVVLLVIALRKKRWTALFASIFASTGLLAYAWFCWRRYGDALYFAHLQSSWGRHASLLGPVRAFTEFRFDPDYYLVSLAAIAAALWMLRRADLPLNITAWFLLLLPLSTGSLKSMIRFQGANVALFTEAGRIGTRGKAAVLALSLGLMFYEVFRYAQGYAHN